MKTVLATILAFGLTLSPAFAAPEKPGTEEKKGQTGSTPQPSQASEKPQGEMDQSKVIASLGDYKITLKDLNDMISQYPPQFRSAFSTFERRKSLVERLLDNKIFSLAAEKEGLDKDPDVQKQLQAQRETILQYAYHRKISNGVTVTDEEAKRYYDNNPKDFTVPEQVKARQILVKEEEEAKKIKEQLAGGAKFEDLAKEKSIDRASKNRGGDLGWVSKGLRGEAWDNVAFALQPGTISDPVKTPLGYHVIKVEEKRPSTVRDFEKEKQNIVRRLKANKEREAVEAKRKQLRADMHARVDEDLLRATSAPDTQPQPGQSPGKGKAGEIRTPVGPASKGGETQPTAPSEKKPEGSKKPEEKKNKPQN